MMSSGEGGLAGTASCGEGGLGGATDKVGDVLIHVQY